MNQEFNLMFIFWSCFIQLVLSNKIVLFFFFPALETTTKKVSLRKLSLFRILSFWNGICRENQYK